MKNLLFIIYLFVSGITLSQWNQIGQNILGLANDDYFGSSIAISGDGNRIAISTPYHDGYNFFGGLGQVWEYNGSNWVQIGQDFYGNTSDKTGSEIDISMDGTRIVIGSDGYSGTYPSMGKAAVYEYSGGVWNQLGSDLDGYQPSDQFGMGVSISGDGSTVAVGTALNDDNGMDAGHVVIYKYNGSNWIVQGLDIEGNPGDNSGGWREICLNYTGERVVIGAKNNNGAGLQAGVVRVYDFVAGSWTQVGADIQGELPGDKMGTAVRIDSVGNRIIVGAPYHDGIGTNNGQVKVYDLVAGTWTQVGSTINGDANYAYAGNAIDINADGSKIIVGLPSDNTYGTGFGVIRVYKYVAGDWVIMNSDLPGSTTAIHDGYAVSITASGNRIGTTSQGTAAAGLIHVFEPCINSSLTPDIANLPDLNGQCEVVAPTNYPTATGNCGNNYTGVPDITFPISTQGTFVITWTFDDGNGNVITQQQNAIVDDTTPPTPNSPSLPDLVGACVVTAFPAPDATDNCTYDIISLNLLPPVYHDTVIIWSYTDAYGNVSTQTQNVIINDNTPPVPDVASLPNVTGVCEITSLTAPSATDACGGSVTVSNDATLPITQTGTIITWTYTDESGNSSTQTQTAVLTDNTPPTASNLASQNYECINDIPAPDPSLVTDEVDNCIVAPTVAWLSDVSDNNTCPETITRTYSVTDNSGNTINVTQQFIIEDLTDPVPDNASLSDAFLGCGGTPTVPTASDNCLGVVNGVSDLSFPITTPGTNVITWTFEDDCGNIVTQTQNAIISTLDNSVTVYNGIQLTANLVAVNYQWLDCDNGYSIIPGATGQLFVPTSNGNYAVELDNGSCTDTSACYPISTVGISDLDNETIQIYPNPNNGNFKLNGLPDQSTINIYSLTGQLIHIAQPENDYHLFKLHDQLPAGVYFIHVISNSKNQIIRITVDR